MEKLYQLIAHAISSPHCKVVIQLWQKYKETK